MKHQPAQSARCDRRHRRQGIADVPDRRCPRRAGLPRGLGGRVNHARLVLAPHHDGCLFPDYAQDHWVTAQDYQSEPWEDIVTLWAAFNRHLLHLLERIPVGRESHTCVITGINDGQPMTVAFLAERYVKHLEHHLGQILGDPA
ncbi:MAG: hypothetical protein HUU25_15525 [Candidatus Sumerlaeia bacterium]|nr:hypothetical protein [Candidatus Sumerlaeia bacterium]